MASVEPCPALLVRCAGAQIISVGCVAVLSEEGGWGGPVGGAQRCGAAAAAREGA